MAHEIVRPESETARIIRQADRDARRLCDDLAAQGYPWHANGYPVFYLSEDNATWCDECAADTDAEPPITHAVVHHEGAAVYCDGCGTAIDSAYGDPWADAVGASAL